MEPITTTALGIALWETLGKPIVEKVQEKYSEQVVSKVGEALSKLPFNKEDKEIIEAEIVKCDQEVIEDRDKFLEYVKQNPKIQNVLKQSRYTIENNYGIQHNEGSVTINNHPNQ